MFAAFLGLSPNELIVLALIAGVVALFFLVPKLYRKILQDFRRKD